MEYVLWVLEIPFCVEINSSSLRVLRMCFGFILELLYLHVDLMSHALEIDMFTFWIPLLEYFENNEYTIYEM